jgi:high-affinity iron transporter
MNSVLVGLGLTLITIIGVAVFVIGAHLPYRKMLVLTGFLVVSIMVTFIGSTVRLFQTVGWLPIHPIVSLEIPSWMGVWLGFYPSWEGLIIPFSGLGYVAAAWLFVKWRSRLNVLALAAQEKLGTPHASPAPKLRADET